jgi:hypothetical protein
MSNQELFYALKMLSSSTKDLATTLAIGRANEKVHQIKSQVTNEAEQRAALHDISNQLVTQLASNGVPATTIAQLTGAVGPRKFGSAAEMAIEGTMMGGARGNQLLESAANVDRASQAGNIDQLRQQQAFAASENAKNRELQLQLAGMKAVGKGGQKPLAGDVEFGTNVEVALKEADKLEKLVDKFGNFEVVNPKASAMLESSAYQLAINYAKIVDPQSVAREGEVAAAQKYLVPLGIGTRNSKSKEAIREYKAKIAEYVEARKKNRPQAPGQGSSAPTASDWQSFIKNP